MLCAGSPPPHFFPHALQFPVVPRSLRDVLALMDCSFISMHLTKKDFFFIRRLTMPPIRKPEMDKLKAHPKPYLSTSLGGSSFRNSFDESPKINLSSSCFGAIRTEKGDPDDDLTSLNWLQNNDILKGFEVSATVPPMSPSRDANGDLFDTPPRGGQAKGPFSPDSLVNKRKSPSKPPYSFSSLIFMAIEEAPGKKLPVKDIYNWIMEHFPYFRDARLGWKNSVRHNLSLNKCFKKVDKDKGQVSPNIYA